MAATGASLRRRPRPRPGARLRRGRPDRGRRRRRRRGEDGDPRPARLRHARSALDDVTYEGITEIQPDDIAYAKELGLSLKLLGVAERRDGGISVRVFPCFLYARPSAGPGRGAVQRGHGRGADDHRDHDVGARARAGRDRDGGARRRRLDPLRRGAGRTQPRARLEIVRDISSSFYLHLEVADRPGRAGADRRRPRPQRDLGAERRPARARRRRPPGDGHARGARERASTRRSTRSRPSTSCAPPPRAIRVIEEEFALSADARPLIERYRDRLPLEAGDPVVTLNEGSTPLVEAPVISERVGARVLLKLEGANPTGSFKDRGMTVAVSRAKGAGAEAVICASTGNTAASAAAYAARAGLRGAVIVPEGKIAIGKLAQALMHGARVIALRGNFDQALEIVRELAETPPGRARQLGQPVPDRGPEDGRVRGLRRARRAARRARDPGRQRRQHHRLVARASPSSAPTPVLYGFQAEGAAPLVHGEPVAEPGDDRLGDPDRQPGALGGGDGGVHRLARADRGGLRRADPRRLPAARLARGRLLRAGLGRLGRRASSPTACPVRRGRRRRPRRSSACSPATGSRTPTPRSARRRR